MLLVRRLGSLSLSSVVVSVADVAISVEMIVTTVPSALPAVIVIAVGTVVACIPPTDGWSPTVVGNHSPLPKVKPPAELESETWRLLQNYFVRAEGFNTPPLGRFKGVLNPECNST